jgi:hypothetical protein
MTQNEILNPELGNPDFDLLYAEDTYRKGQKLQDKYLDSLYDSIKIETPSAGSVVRSTYLGMMSNQYVFSVVGYKDDVRIENKPGEAKYLNSIEIGEQVDPIIIGIVVAKTGSFFGGLAFIGVVALIGALSYTFVVGEVRRLPEPDEA